jgi:hypothetical protein
MKSSSTIRVWNPSDAPSAPVVKVAPPIFRGGYRLVEDRTALIAFVGRRKNAMRVTEFSPHHIVVRRAAREVALVELSPAVRLRSARGREVEVRTRVVEDQRGTTDAECVLAIEDPSLQMARAILSIGEEMEISGNASLPSARPVIRDSIDNVEKQRWIMDKMVRNRASGIVRLGDFPVATVVPIRVEGDAIFWQLSGSEVAGPITIELMGFSTLYKLGMDGCVLRGHTLITPMPSRMVRLRNRAYRRASAPPNTRIDFHHPLFSAHHISREVRELSASGLSFRTNVHDDVLYPGLMTEMNLVANGEQIEFSGEVKSLSRSHCSQDRYCGLAVYPSSSADETRWLRFLDDQLYPNTRTGSRWAKETWKLYERAGYFDLSGKKPEHFAALAHAFEATSKRLDEAPELGGHAVWPVAGNGVEGAISFLKVYSGTWFLFQLAKVKGDLRDNTPGMAVLREVLVRGYEHAQRDPDIRWLLGICQVKKVWSRLFFYDFPMEYVASGKANIVRCRTLEVPTIEDPVCPSDVEVDHATKAEVQQLLTRLGGMRASAYLEGLDLTSEQYDLGAIAAAWSQAGFTRRRTTLVARRHGRAVAAAVLESADDGLHLFRLHDCARPFALVPGGEDTFGALLTVAGSWYRTQGKTAYVAFVEDHTDIPKGLPDGTEDLGLADIVLLAAEHIPELLEQLSALTAPKFPM